jgi:hypothetical protein
MTEHPCNKGNLSKQLPEASRIRMARVSSEVGIWTAWTLLGPSAEVSQKGASPQYQRAASIPEASFGELCRPD